MFDESLIDRYDLPGPRYTSYPSPTEFHNMVSESDYREWARLSNEELIPRPLSLYFHIPFCSSVCYYCANNDATHANQQDVEPYLQGLYREIEIQSQLFDRDREVRQLHWGGGTPGYLSCEQSRQLMDKIDQHFRLDRAGSGEFSIEIDPRVIEADGVAQLRKLGFNRINIGVQDLSGETQRAVDPIRYLEPTARVIGEARRRGFRSINIDLIYGLPGQSVASFTATLDTVIGLRPDRIAVFNHARLPHRFLPRRRTYAVERPESVDRLSILRKAIDMLSAAGYDYIGMDHFSRGDDALAQAQRDRNLHRNFQGYSAHARCDSIGFGVSAISQVCDNLSQNTFDLQDYHDSLDQQRLPVARGFQTDDDDLLRREIINELLCHLSVDMRKIGQRWQIDFAEYFRDELSRLAEMERDGLLDIDNDEIIVHEPGRLLVCNICMVFDCFQQPQRDEKRLSRTI